MKAVILAGGFGTRISEESVARPKPMIEIGGKPIIWHIMKYYSSYGIDDFIICLGYRGYLIKEYFANYFLHMSDVTFDMRENAMHVHEQHAEPWRVTLVDTGEHSMTGGRLRRVHDYLGEDEPFCFTYGDGLADIDIAAEISFHRQHNRLATVAAIRPPGRFGALQIDGTQVSAFSEKPSGDGGWINGGFFVLSPGVIDYIDGDDSVWEKEPLERIVAAGQLSAFHHEGFWQPMDTMRDKILLDGLWAGGNAPWKRWP